MSATIDERVVEMKFDNSDFEKNVHTSLDTLEKFNKSLDFTESAKNFDAIGKAANSVNFSTMESGIDAVREKFSALEIAGITAIAKITDRLMDAGSRFIKSVSIDQVTSGFEKYANVTSSVQTILAATREQGETIESVTAQVERLLWFTDETSYSLIDMTNNISKFTSNGVKLADATTQMQGIAAAAALSGANAQDASHAMTGFSKAMGQQYMNRQSWSFIRTAHMDTMQFKSSLIEAAVELGTLQKVGEGVYETVEGNTVSLTDFETAMKDAWISAGVMEKALGTYGSFAEELYDGYERLEEKLTTTEILDALEEFKDGTLDIDKYASKAGVSVEDLTSVLETLNDSSLDLGNRSFRAAQEAKTFQEAIDSVKDAVSSGWMKTFDLIFGNYEEAKKLWTGVANAMYDVFAESGNVRNEILSQWKDMGGRDSLITGMVAALNAIAKPINAAKEGFKSLFPDVEGMADLIYKLTERFREFAENMQPSEEFLKAIYTTFKMVATIGKTLLTVIKSILSSLSPLLKPISIILKYAFTLVSFINLIITAIAEWLGENEKLGAVILAGIVILLKWRSVIAGLTKGILLLKAAAIPGLIAALLALAGVAIVAVIRNFDKLKETFSNVVSAIGEKFSGLREKFKELEDVVSFSKVGGKIKGVFGNVATFISDSFKKISSAFSENGLLGGIKQLSSTMSGKLIAAVAKVAFSFSSLGRLIPLKFKIIGAAISKLLPKFIDFSKLPSKLKPIGTGIASAFSGVASKIAGFFTATDKLHYALNVLKLGVHNVISVFKVLGGSIASIAVGFGTKALGAIKSVIDAFKNAIGIVGLLRKGVSAHELETSEEVDKLNNSLQDTADETEATGGILQKIKDIFSSIPEPIKNAASAIKDFFSNLDPGQVVAIAFATTMLALVFALSKFISTSTKLVSAVKGNVVTNVGGLLKSLTGAVDDFRNLKIFKKGKNVKQTFKDFAEGIAIIGVVIGALSFIPEDQLKSTIKYFGGLMIVFGGLYTAMLILTSILNKRGLNPTAAVQSIATMIGMVASIAGLAATLLILKDYPIDDSILAKLLLIFALGSTMIALMAFMTRIPGLEKKGFLKQMVGMVLFAVSIGRVVKAFKDLAGMGIDTVKEGLVPLLALISAIGLLSITAGHVKISSVLGFYLLVKVFESLFPALQELAKTISETFAGKFDFDKLLNMTEEQSLNLIGAATAIAIAASTVGAMFFLMSEAIGKIITGVLALALAIAIITKVANSWQELDPNQFKQVVTMVLTIFGGYAAILAATSLLKVDKKTQKIGMHIGATALALTLAFGLLLGLAEIIGYMPAENFAKAEAMIITVMGLFAAIVGLTKLSEKANPKVIMSISASIIALMAALIILSVIKPERLIAPTIAMGVVMASFGNIIKQVGKMNPNANSFKTLLVVMGILAEVSLALGLMAYYCDWTSILASAGAMTAVFLSLAAVMSQIAKMKPNKEAFKALLAVTAPLLAIGISLALIARNDWGSILAAGGAMAGALLAFSFMLKTISSSSGLGNDRTYKKKLLMLAVAAGVVVALGGSMALLARYSWEQIGTSMLAITGSVLMLVAALYLVSKTNFDLKQIGKFAIGVAIELAALYGIAKLMPYLSDALSSMESVNWGAIGKSAVAMLATIGIITGLGIVLGKVGGGMGMVGVAIELASILAFAYMLPILGETLAKMDGVSWSSIGKTAVALLATLGIITGLGMAIMAVPFAWAGLALEMLSILGMAYFLPVLGETLKKMVDVPWEGIGKSAVGLLATIGILTGLGVLASFFAFGMVAEILALVGVALFLPLLGDALMKMADVPWKGIGKAAVALLATIGILTGLGVLATFDFIGIAASIIALALMIPILIGLASALTTFSAVPWDGIEKAAITIIGLGGAMVILGAMIPLLAPGAVGLMLMSAALGIAGPAIEIFATAISNAAIKIAEAVLMIKAAFSKSADFGAAGMIEGFSRVAPAIAQAGEGVGKSFLGGFYSAVGQASPWSTTQAAMGYMAEGIVKGEEAVDGVIEEAGGEAGKSFLGGLLDALKSGLISLKDKLGNIFDFGSVEIDLSSLDGIKNTVTSAANVVSEKVTGAGGLAENIFNLNDYLKENGIDLENIDLDIESLIPDLSTLTQGIGGAGGAAEKAADEFKDLHDSISQTLESKTGGMNFFNKLELSATTSAKTILENMKSNVDGVASWTARLGKVMERGLNKDLVKTLAEAGLDSYDQVTAFMNMTDEEIQQANDLFLQAAAGRAYSANEVTSGYIKLGLDNMKGLAKGTEQGADQVVDAVEEANQEGLDKADEINGHHSPSEWWRTLGLDNMRGLYFGTYEGSNMVYREIIRVCQLIKDAMRNNLSYDYFKSIGYQVCSGLAKGISENSKLAETAAKSMAESVGAATAKALEVESPSKLAFRIGRFFDVGLAKGITDSAGTATDAAANLSRTITDPLVDAFDQANTYIAKNMDLNPVIRPSLDLSNVYANAQSLNGLMESSRMAYNAQVDSSWSNPSVRSKFMEDLSDIVGTEYADRVVDAINSKDNSTNVYLEGDAAGVFKIVRRENRSFIKRTGYNGLA